MLDPPRRAYAMGSAHKSALKTRCLRRATVVARKKVIVMELKRSVVDRLVGPLEEILISRAARLEEFLSKVFIQHLTLKPVPKASLIVKCSH